MWSEVRSEGQPVKGNRQEAEVIIRLDQQDGLAHICVASWPAMARKMARLYGPSVDTGQSQRWKVPLKRVGFRRLDSKVGKQSKGRFVAAKRSKPTLFGETTAEV